MPKPLKYLLLTTLFAPLLLVVAFLVVITVIDPNDFKPSIESAAKEHAELNLNIDGTLSWSLMPLGIDINEVKILDQNLKPFAEVKKLFTQVELISIFKGQPKIKSLLLEGLTLHLLQTNENDANWENILPKSAMLKTDTSKEKTAETESVEDKNPSNLEFLVESLEIRKADLRFKSIPLQQDLALEDLNLRLNNIALDQAFPLSLDFLLDDTINNTKISSQLSGSISVSKDFRHIQIGDLVSQHQLSSPSLLPNPAKSTFDIELKSNIAIDTKTEIIDINSLQFIFDEAKLVGNINVTDYSSKLSVSGDLELTPLSLQSQMRNLGITLPETQNKSALSTLSLKTGFKFVDDLFSMEQLSVQLDKSTWEGDIELNLGSQALVAQLSGNSINIDHYLPPQSDKPESEELATQKPKQQNDEPLIPLELVRSLSLDIDLKQKHLIAHQLEMTDTAIKVKADKGRIELRELSTLMYEGKINATGLLDASTDTPSWSAKQDITRLNIGALIQALPEYQQAGTPYSASGTFNLTASQKSIGNTVEALNKNAKAQSNFELSQGAIEGISLNTYACQGLAFVNRDKVDTSDWPKTTPFNSLKGKLTLANQIADTDFKIATSGLKVISKGSINLLKEHIDIGADLNVVGELGNKACRVNDKLKDIIIPMKCAGSINTPPAKLCALDTSKLGKSLKKVAKKEVKRKVEKEIDRALKKHLGKEGKKLKKLFKGLF